MENEKLRMEPPAQETGRAFSIFHFPFSILSSHLQIILGRKLRKRRMRLHLVVEPGGFGIDILHGDLTFLPDSL